MNTLLKNITVRSNHFDGAVDALRIKSDPGATGYLRDVLYDGNTMVRTSGHTVYITMEYPKPNPGARTTFVISNVTFRNTLSVDAKLAGEFDCVADSPCWGITVANVTHGGAAPAPWTCKNAHGVVVDPVSPSLTCLSA